MGKLYRVKYASDGKPHTRYFTALTEETANSMFLEEVERHGIVVDDSNTVGPVLVEDNSGCSKPTCSCDCGE